MHFVVSPPSKLEEIEAGDAVDSGYSNFPAGSIELKDTERLKADDTTPTVRGLCSPASHTRSYFVREYGEKCPLFDELGMTSVSHEVP